MKKRLALITGASRKVGIAAGVARSVVRAGWDVALNYWTPYDERMPWGAQQNDVSSLATELSSMGAEVLTISLDLEPRDAAVDLFRAIANIGPVSALILSHCESVPSSLLSTDVVSLDRHYAVNVRSNLQLIQQFAAQIPSRRKHHCLHERPYRRKHSLWCEQRGFRSNRACQCSRTG